MAVEFNGTNQDITYTLNAGQVGNTQESWSFWLYADAVGQYRRPMHIGIGGANRDRSFEMDDGWGFVFNFGFSSSGGSWSVAKPGTGSWIHYAVTFDGASTSNDPIVYKNGVVDTLTERSGPSGTFKSSRTDLTIGSEFTSGQYWDGRLAEMAKWSRILTVDEVVALSKGFAPTFFKKNLVLYLPLKGRASNEPDQIFGITGTAHNTPTYIEHPRMAYPVNQG